MESSITASISIVGAGNVANQLGHALKAVGYDIAQVIARNEQAGVRLALSLEASYIQDFAVMKPVDVVIIAVVDDVIGVVSQRIPKTISKTALIVHTSGSVSLDSLDMHKRRAVIWPLQSILKDRQLNWEEIPLIVSTVHGEDFEYIQSIFGKVSNTIVRLDDLERHRLHAPAVMVNNFTTFIYGMAADICRKEQVDFKLLLPLIEESTRRLKDVDDPMLLLTGPAQRDDQSTIRKHKRALSRYPDQMILYTYITDMILTLRAKYNNYR